MRRVHGDERSFRVAAAGAVAVVDRHARHAAADPVRGYAVAHRDHLARHLAARNPRQRLRRDRRDALQRARARPGLDELNPGRRHLHEQPAGTRDRVWHLFDPQHFRTAELPHHDRSHGAPP